MHALYDLDFGNIGKFFNAKVRVEAQTVLFSKLGFNPEVQWIGKEWIRHCRTALIHFVKTKSKHKCPTST